MKKETRFKSIIVAFSTLLFFIITSILIWTETIHFGWSDRILNQYRYEQSKKKDVRILVLGDSQLEDWPLDHCLHKDIERFCIENNFGCINAAHHGFGPLEYRDRFFAIAPDYQPNVVIIFYYAGNDLSDVAYRPDDNPRKPTYDFARVDIASTKEEDTAKVTKPEWRNSADPAGQDSANILSGRAGFDWEELQRQGVHPQMIGYAKNRMLHPNAIGPEYVNPFVLTMGTWKPRSHFDNTNLESVESRYAWYRIVRMFEDIIAEARSMDAVVCLVSIPSNVQIDTSHFDFYRKTAHQVDASLNRAKKPQQLLDELAAAAGILHLNLLPVFRSQRNTAGLYFENDDHLSERGHTVAFEAVKKAILDAIASGKALPAGNPDVQEIYRRYDRWALDFHKHRILSDSLWLEKTKEKALQQSLSLDSMLEIDARYLLGMEK